MGHPRVRSNFALTPPTETPMARDVVDSTAQMINESAFKKLLDTRNTVTHTHRFAQKAARLSLTPTPTSEP